MRGFYLLLISFVLSSTVVAPSVRADDWRPVAPHRAGEQSEIVLIQHEQPVARLAYQQPAGVIQEPNLLLAQAVEAVPANQGDYVYLPEGASPAVVVPYATDPYCGEIDCFDEPEQRDPFIGVFGEYLYLSPRNANVAYAVPQDGIGFLGATPMGPVAAVDPEYSHGFRFGAFFKFGPNAKIRGTYTWYENSSDSSVTTDPPLVINPLVMFPGTFNAGFTAQEASASYDLNYEFIDVDYEVNTLECEDFWVGYILGARYAKLDQNFNATFPFAQPDGTTTVGSAINFDGIGVRGGVQGERWLCPDKGFRVYGKGVVSLLAGQFSSSYIQENQFNGVEVSTAWSEDRIVPIVDLEAGLAWVGPNEHFRISGGYMISAWYNTLTTPVWIQGVQQQNFVSLKDHLTFDGLVARVELQY